ncbi:MAG TPA: SIS domain-containing protein [Candidatus Methanoperedens sp.]
MSFERSVILDNVDRIKELDRSDMYSYLCSVGKDTLDSYKKARNIFTFPSGIKNIVVAGMGGSGMAPTVLVSLFRDELTVPCVLSQDYNIPYFVDSNTLFIAISDSGETEEIISQYFQARERGAKIIVIGQGKTLMEIAKKDKTQNFKYSTSVPARVSFAYMFGSTIACLENIGVIHNDKEEGLEESKAIVNELNDKIGIDVPTKDNIAKKIALLLKKRIPILYIEPPFESLGPRFAKMFNENSRNFAFYNRFPEIRHNEIMSWTSTSDFMPKFIPILLRDNMMKSKMEEEIEVIKKFLGSDVIEFRAVGKSKISRFYYLLHLTDMISYYEAILVNKDPSETDELKDIKKILRTSSILPHFSP